MDPSYEEVIQAAWVMDHYGTPMFNVSEKLKATRHHLLSWSKTHFGSVRYSIAEKTHQLKSEEDVDLEVQNVGRIKTLRSELSILFIKEERMWQQRSRVLWLQSGDQNTRFFHCQGTHHRGRNHIKV